MLNKIKTENDKADMLIQAREKSYMYVSTLTELFVKSVFELYGGCLFDRGFFAASIEAYGPAPLASSSAPAAALSNTAPESAAPASGEENSNAAATVLMTIYSFYSFFLFLKRLL